MIKIQSTAPTVLHDRSDRFNTAFYTVFSRLNSIYIFHFPLSTKSFHFHLYLYRAISKSKCENNLLYIWIFIIFLRIYTVIFSFFVTITISIFLFFFYPTFSSIKCNLPSNRIAIRIIFFTFASRHFSFSRLVIFLPQRLIYIKFTCIRTPNKFFFHIFSLPYLPLPRHNNNNNNNNDYWLFKINFS